MSFIFEKLALPEVILVKPRIFGDSRGYFMETYKKSEFTAMGIAAEFVQDNQSVSAKNIFRGLHYQLAPKAQGKLVRALSGAILDFAVDVRAASPTFGKWVSARLDSENKHMLWIPEGFAHGFLSLEDGTVVAYKATAEYSKEHERGISWNDPNIALRIPTARPILSEKDAALPQLEEAVKVP